MRVIETEGQPGSSRQDVYLGSTRSTWTRKLRIDVALGRETPGSTTEYYWDEEGIGGIVCPELGVEGTLTHRITDAQTRIPPT